MADKTIGSLPEATELDAESLMVTEQLGEARRVTGELLANYAKEAAQKEAEKAEEYAKNAEESANIAEEKAEEATHIATKPPIIQNETWWTWNEETGDYADSGIDASVSLSIADTITGAPGTEALVENIGTNTDLVLRFTIPQGEKGEVGSVNSVNSQTGDVILSAEDVEAIPSSEKGTSGGVATLNTEGQVVQVPAMLCNPNLLDNWYMGKPINQRGQTAYSTEDSWLYGIDRWKIANATISTTGGKVRFQASGTEGRYKRMTQVLENGLKKGQYTLSVLAKVNEASGSVSLRACNASYSAIPGAPGKALTVSGAYTVYSNTFTLTEDIEGAGVEILCGGASGNSADIDILAWKLETGPNQTLAYERNGVWELREYPNPALELAKCQRYQLPVRYDQVRAVFVSTNTAFFSVPTPVTMRAIPTIINNNMYIRNPAGGATVEGFTFTVSSLRSNGIGISATKTAHGLTDASLNGGDTSAIFDANL